MIRSAKNNYDKKRRQYNNVMIMTNREKQDVGILFYEKECNKYNEK